MGIVFVQLDPTSKQFDVDFSKSALPLMEDQWEGWSSSKQDVISLAKFAVKPKRFLSFPNVAANAADELYRKKAYSWIPESMSGKNIIISNYSLV